MSDRVPTVRVASPDGYVIINRSDLTPEHVILDEMDGGASAPPAVEPATYASVADADAYFAAAPEPVSDEAKEEALQRAEDFLAEPVERKAVHRGRGSYSIMSNGEEIVEGLKRAEADVFNAASPAEQQAFIANRAKG